MREISVEVDADTVSKAFRTVVKKYQKLARIPGFRVGKVPETVIKSRFAKEVRQEVLDSLVPKEVEVQTQAGTWYLLRIRPYRTLENVIEGAVITFTDILRLRRRRRRYWNPRICAAWRW